MIHSWIVGRLFLVASSAADPDQTRFTRLLPKKFVHARSVSVTWDAVDPVNLGACGTRCPRGGRQHAQPPLRSFGAAWRR